MFIFAENMKPAGQIFTLIYLSSRTSADSSGVTEHKPLTALSRTHNLEHLAKIFLMT